MCRESKLRLGAHESLTYLFLVVIWAMASKRSVTFLFITLSANLKESPKAASGYCGDVCLRLTGVPGNTGLLSSVSEGLNGIKSGFFRHRDYIDFTLPTLVKMKFPNKASSLKPCADVAPHTFQLVVILFVAVAAAVPTEMLKREPSLCHIAPANRISGTFCENGFATELPAHATHADSFGNKSLFGCPYHGYPGGHWNPLICKTIGIWWKVIAEVFFKLAAGAQEL
ncbi:hypothetical protein C8R44DRAFT_753207 [Mycena epipterygia]|nr:hypothetical protein C8R44DRAFT_753207 [Mycena epipterygia]